MKTEIVCSFCGAVCTERNELNRFLKRHPAKCQERKAFTQQLSEGVRSVVADEKRDWFGDREAAPANYNPDRPAPSTKGGRVGLSSKETI